jgi:hypothetical protein
VNLVKRIKPGTWVIVGFAAFIILVGGLMVGKYVSSLPVHRDVVLALYNDKSDTRKVDSRVELAVRLDLSDTTGAKYAIQLEGRQAGAWQIIKKYTATKPLSTVVFRVHPARTGDIVYRAEVQTPTGVLTTNELVLHVTK